MDKFQDAYRDAMDALPEFRTDADAVRDELRHYRMKRRKRNYMLVKGCTAASVFLLCGVGTVAAKNYRDSVIRVNDTGVIITAVKLDEDPASPMFSVFEQLGGVFSAVDFFPDEEISETYELDVVEYSSLKEFLAKEDVTVALPDRTLFGTELTIERVNIVDDGRDVTVQLYNGEYSFCMTQFDNREVECYSTAMTFGGHSSNERNFTNSQGLTYVVFDTLDEKGQVISVCAVISVNGWDLTLTFRGFEKNVIEEIINSIDLSIYY